MNTAKYWKTCRLYRLPDKVVQRDELNPRAWSYLIPTSKDGLHLGNFPILSVTKKNRREISAIYHSDNISMHNKSGAESDLYWLFELGEPIENMPELAAIEKRKVVLLGETQ